MSMDKVIGKFNKLKSADGKTIGEDGEMITSQLAKSDKQAWINHLTEQRLKHEPLDTPPSEFGIDIGDILKELTIREIRKALGK